MRLNKKTAEHTKFGKTQRMFGSLCALLQVKIYSR